MENLDCVHVVKRKFQQKTSTPEEESQILLFIVKYAQMNKQ